MIRNRGLTFQLSLLILTSAGIISILLYGYNFYRSGTIVYKEVDKNATSTVEKFAFRIESIVKNVEKIAYISRNFIEQSEISHDEIERFLRKTVSANVEIYGSSICFEPYALDSNVKYKSFYYYKDGGDVKSANLSDPNYFYPDKEWYTEPIKTNNKVWSEPYYDEGGGNILMSTFSIPLYRDYPEGKKIIGVMTCDLSLTWLKDIISEMNVYEGGYGFLLSKNARFLAHPNTNLIMKKTVFDLAEDTGIEVLVEMGRRMTAGEKGDITTTSVFLGTKSLVRFHPLEVNGWSLAVLFPHKEIYKDLVQLGIETTVLGVLGFVILFFVLVWVSRKLSRPLNAITSAAELIASGDLKNASEKTFEYREDYNSVVNKCKSKNRKMKNEIIRLFVSINQMTENLYSLIEQVQRSGVQVGSSTNEITASSHELEANATEQAASTREVSSTSKQISSTSSELSKSIHGISQRTDYALQIAHKGKESLSSLDEAMGNLNHSTKSITSKLSIISEKANKISSVVTAINKISEQTNLLSFNAAIEAEKAGEYGKGFSVVAREISRLADQTAVATEDIEKMVKEMQSSVSSGVMEMDKFSDEVRKGAGHIYSVAGQLGEVIEQVNEFAPSFTQFAQGMDQQTEAAMQISEAMNQLAKASEQSKESLAEFRKASMQLNEAVMILQREVNKFVL